MKDMSRAKRRQQAKDHAKRQKKILKSKESDTSKVPQFQDGRFDKQNAMDCGVSRCGCCGNPRKFSNGQPKDKLTFQEVKAIEFYMVDGLEFHMTEEEKQDEINKIVQAIDAFTHEMKKSVIANVHKGRLGWDDKRNEIAIRREAELRCGYAEQEVDVANYMMMLWNMRREK